VTAAHPELEIDGEMHADTALHQSYRERVFPHSRLHGEANVLILPSLDAANIADQMIAPLPTPCRSGRFWSARHARPTCSRRRSPRAAWST
jgi:hypothetical protein